MTRRRFLGGFSISPLQGRYSSRNEVEHNQVSVTVTAAHAGTTSVLLCSSAAAAVTRSSMAGGRTAVHSEGQNHR
jgi:hypothetical protein